MEVDAIAEDIINELASWDATLMVSLQKKLKKKEDMNEQTVNFAITGLAARVDESVPLEWQDKEFDSGPLTVELDESVPGGNHGELDYSQRHARAEFHLRIRFPELASTLQSLGVDHEFTRPVSAVLRSEGEILEDHSLALSGNCDFSSRALFPSEETRACVLRGR